MVFCWLNFDPLRDSMFFTFKKSRKIVVIYTVAGIHPIQNAYSHGSRLPYQKVYIHGNRASSIKFLFTRPPFFMTKGLYTRLSCIYFEIVVYAAAVSHDKMFICMAASIIFFTRQPFPCKVFYMHCL